MNSKERRRAQRERNRQYGEEFKVLQVRARLAGVPVDFIPSALGVGTQLYRLRRLVRQYETAAFEGKPIALTTQGKIPGIAPTATWWDEWLNDAKHNWVKR